ncbi:hypothetical protein Bca52824_081299 [Brassica carinata]|uniref:Uncharacterized protein n=1 Tax=Brassica carinata TaxID=52824 RepID=A0A8X7PIA7_BRACI|nr:hypothetical protein Bca52824_081299 [Brassica carinata]
MARDQKGELTKEEKLLIKAMTNHINQTMDKMMKAKMEELRQEVKHKRPRATGQSHEYRRSERRQRCEHESRGSHRDKLSETKPCSANSVQKQQFRIRSSSTGVIGLPSKTTSFSEEDTKELSQVILDVEKQLRETNTTRPSLEEQSQESITSVSELNSTEPQPVQDVMVSIIQDMKEKEAPKEPQSDCELNQLIVFDPCDFQNTFFGTFLISPFVWNKPRAVEPSRHELGINHVVFEPGGELWSHGNNTIMIEKKSAAITISFSMKPTVECYQLCPGSKKPDNKENGHLMIKILSIFQNILVWLNYVRCLYLIMLKGYRPTHGDLEHMSKKLSSLESALLVLEPAGVVRSWKLIKMPCFLIMSRCGSHQICKSFNTISEIVKP